MITIITQPDNYRGQYGKFAEFAVEATSSYEISYQWQYQSPNTAYWYNIIGATDAIYKFVLNQQYGTLYRCVLTDNDGSVTSQSAYTIQLTTTPARGFSNGFYWGEVYGILTQDERVHNIQRFCNRLYWWGWARNPICAVAGNVWLESDTSPGTWQEFDYMFGPDQDYRGYGFVQWSPVFHYSDWAVQYYPDTEWRNNGELQLARLYFEWKNNLEWQQWDAFIHSTRPIDELVEIFIVGYLGVQAGQEGSLPARKAQANWIDNNLKFCPAPWILKKVTERGRKNK